MELPDWSYRVPRHEHSFIDAGEMCSRIFNHVDAAAYGYSAYDFNPLVPRAVDTEGGRFDATATDKFPYLYGATSLEAAIHERILPLAANVPGGPVTLAGSEVEDRSWCTFFIDERLELVDLTQANGLGHFKATTELVYCVEYSKTREWCRYIRDNVRGCQGLRWLSRPHGGLPVFVLFGDRLGSAVVQPGTAVPFDSVAGRKVLSSVCAKAGVTLNWP